MNSQTTTTLPVLSVDQRMDMLRAGAATVADQLASALPDILAAALEDLSARRDADAGALAAKRFLSTRRDELRQAWAARLKQEQSGALGRLIKRDKPAAAGPKITADLLSLVDDDEADQTEVATKAARRMQNSMINESRDVQLVVQYLAGRENIRPDDDPFAPEACMKSLLEAARELGLEAEGRGALVGAVERPMADALARSHAALAARFRGFRLEAGEIRREMATRQALGRPALGPATQLGGTQRQSWTDDVPRAGGVAQSAAQEAGGAGDHSALLGALPGGSVQSAGQAPATSDEALEGPMTDVRASLDDFIQRMSTDVHGAMAPAVLPQAGRPPADLLDAINAMQQLGARLASTAAAVPVGVAPAELAPAGAALAVPMAAAEGAEKGQWREALMAKSTRTVDKLTIEIVGVLFEHVLQDEQVPAEIKAVLSRLQFPVLKVALTDADFFASAAHPARVLIDRLASTAVGWEPYGDENLRYKEEVERIVQQVLERFDKDTGTFEQLLAEFEAFLGEMPTRETDPIVRAKRALEEAETREVLVINTTIQVRRAFEHFELEAYLREFLVGPWVQVLVTATQREEQTPGFSKAFRQAIHDMVWSVQPKVSAEERKRLVTLIPAMTRVVRDGLGLIRMSPEDQQAFLKQLMASHAVAVRPVDQATYIKSRVATGDLRQKLDEMSISGTAPAGAPGSVLRVSVNAVKRAAEHHAAQLEIAEPLSGAPALGFEQEAEYDAQIANWQRGSWFSLHDGKQMIKVKLRWISPLRTLYMFSGGEEKNARVLSPEAIKSYLKQGWLKPLEAEPLMKRVVDRVVDELGHATKRAEELVEKIRATEAPKPH